MRKRDGKIKKSHCKGRKEESGMRKPSIYTTILPFSQSTVAVHRRYCILTHPKMIFPLPLMPSNTERSVLTSSRVNSSHDVAPRQTPLSSLLILNPNTLSLPLQQITSCIESRGSSAPISHHTKCLLTLLFNSYHNTAITPYHDKLSPDIL